jgi:hypothetical protein
MNMAGALDLIRELLRREILSGQDVLDGSRTSLCLARKKVENVKKRLVHIGHIGGKIA